MIAFFLVFAIIVLVIGWLVVTRQLRKKWKAAHPLGIRIPFDYTDDDIFTLIGTIFVERWVYGRKLIANLRYGMIHENFFRPDYKPTRAIFREEYWTDAKSKELGVIGYKPVTGLHDSILWLGVKTYMIVENGRSFVVPDTRDEKGDYLYPQDTAEILYDNAVSSATQKFIASMSKAQRIGNMDSQTIIMIILVGIGAIFGMYMMGVFR